MISDLLGVPHSRADDFARYGATIGSALDGIKSLRHARALMQANAELEKLFEELFALRRREPADDVISTIVAASGTTVRPAEMVPLCVLLLIAGFETTVNLISNGTLGSARQSRAMAGIARRPDACAVGRRGGAAVRPAGPAHRPARVGGRRARGRRGCAATSWC